MTYHYPNDTYLSGAPINLVVNHNPYGTLCHWNLPSGDRIISTLTEYNKSFPEIFNNEQAWLDKFKKAKSDF